LRFLALASACGRLPLIRSYNVVQATSYDHAAPFWLKFSVFGKLVSQGVIDHFFGLIEAYLVMLWLFEVAGVVF
jgi:hypothetical protein